MIEYKKSDFTETELNFIQGNSNSVYSLKQMDSLLNWEFAQLIILPIMAAVGLIVGLFHKGIDASKLEALAMPEVIEQVTKYICGQITLSIFFGLSFIALVIIAGSIKQMMQRKITELCRIRSECLSGIAKLVD